MLVIGVIIGVDPIIRMKNLGVLCNNTPKFIWVLKIASKARSRIFGRLIQAIKYLINTNHISPMETIYIAGDGNLMSDISY